MKNLYHDPGSIVLMDTVNLTADTNSKYIDTLGLLDLVVEISGLATTSDGGTTNYFTPRVYGYTGSAPGTASGYTELTAATDYDGTLSAISTGHFIQTIGLLQKNYRYYYIKMDETGTADIHCMVKASFLSEDMPSRDVTPTTGTVT